MVSNDGTNWSIPSGITDVLAEEPEVGHNCDTDMIFNPKTNELWMYYIETDDAKNKQPGIDYLRVLKTSNGIYWRNELVFSSPKAYSILGQSVIYRSDLDKFEMWYVNSGENSRVEYRSSLDGMNWSPPKFTYFDAKFQQWHVEVKYIASKGEYWMLFPAVNKESVMDTAIYFAKSSNGLLIHDKLHIEFCNIHHIICFIHDNHTAGAHHGTYL